MNQLVRPLGMVYLLFAAASLDAAGEDAVALWGRWEQRFTAEPTVASNSELVVELASPSGRKVSVPGFWDGKNVWRVRFMPDEAGKWRYRTRSQPAAAGLDGQEGSFTCRAGESALELYRHGALRVAKAKTHLEHADETPLFWLGDTVWNGPALATADDWREYLQDRAARRFSVIQFNAICPWRTAPTDREGQAAYRGSNPIEINPAYFQRLDGYFDAINAAGMVAAPVLIWAHKAGDAGMELSEADVIRLVRYELARYGAHHVVWILAGDNSYKPDQADRWKRIGRAAFGQQAHAPVTTHPTGMNWPWESWREESWLDILGYQSGHGDDAGTLKWIHSGPPDQHWNKTPQRPIINLEPPYEDHLAYQSRRPHSASSVRRAVYWSLLNAPTAGVTYGGHGIWSWQTAAGQTPRDHPGSGTAKTWREALRLAGASDMQRVAEFFSSIAWWKLRPAQDLLAAQPGDKDPARFISAASSPAGDLAVLYLPKGGEVQLDLRKLKSPLRAEWFDPRTGEHSKAAIEAAGQVTAPTDEDWVLCLRK